MQFVWDDKKSRRNLAKHKISFETAALAFEDPTVFSRLDRVVDGEERWQTMGLVGGVMVLLVAHTVFEEKGEEGIRIISARRATRHEREQYEQQQDD